MQFETYCAPILHLGGLSIDVIKTESEGYARQYIEQLDKLPQAILCAGGDGTVSEVVTGAVNIDIALFVWHTHMRARTFYRCD